MVLVAGSRVWGRVLEFGGLVEFWVSGFHVQL